MIREWLVKAREDKKMTQGQVAKLVGVDRSAYTRYETGMRTPRPETALNIATVLGVEVKEFFWPCCDETELKNKTTA